MRHIYIHIPFCRRRCVYCDFAIAVRKRVPSDRLVSAISRELEARRQLGTWDDAPIETIYLGGGTPSLLSADALARLLDEVRRVGGGSMDADAEVTLEANPDDVSNASADAWVAAGINRVSLGAQSFHDRVLEWMHRTHDADATVRAVRALRDAGVGSFSLDLIFALPPELEHDIEMDLDHALELEPTHLSVYGLTLEPQTPLAHFVARGQTGSASEDVYASEFLTTHARLTAAGFEHYEISNHAKPGHRARHNAAYWSGVTYGGVGPSAHSYSGTTRRWNERDWAAYEKAVAERGDPVAGREELNADQKELERLFLGLRTIDGVPSSRANNWSDRLAAIEAGWLEDDGERARLTPKGWLRIETLIPRLTTSAEGG